MPRLGHTRIATLVLLLLVWLHVALHEGGHALAAWIVGFRFKALGMGPFAIYKGSTGYRFRFEWRRILLTGGFMGAVPATEQGIWFNQTFVIAAGPLTSLTAGAAFGLVFFLLPGTSLERYWDDVAIAALLGLYLGCSTSSPWDTPTARCCCI